MSNFPCVFITFIWFYLFVFLVLFLFVNICQEPTTLATDNNGAVHSVITEIKQKKKPLKWKYGIMQLLRSVDESGLRLGDTSI